MRGPGWIGENGGSDEEEEIASREARRTGGGCAGAGGRTRELVVQPRSDGVEAYVSHSAPREAVFSIPGHTARVRHAPRVRRLERRRAPVRDGRLRRLVQPPPPQHLIRLGETLEEALDDDVPGRRHHRHAKHAARHGGRFAPIARGAKCQLELRQAALILLGAPPDLTTLGLRARPPWRRHYGARNARESITHDVTPGCVSLGRAREPWRPPPRRRARGARSRRRSRGSRRSRRSRRRSRRRPPARSRAAVGQLRQVVLRRERRLQGSSRRRHEGDEQEARAGVPRQRSRAVASPHGRGCRGESVARASKI